MQLEVRLFGGLTERARTSRILVDLGPDPTVADLRAAVAGQHPSLASSLRGVKVVVDLEVAGDQDLLPPGAEVALLPPVAGGAGDSTGSSTDGTANQRPDTATPAAGLPIAHRHEGRICMTGLVAAPIDVTGALAAVSGPDVGGTVLFLGTVRDHAPDLDGVTGLDYSTYPEMAEKVLADLAAAIVADHPAVRGIALLHTVGDLHVGDHTILIICSAAHRAPAFAACEDALERVKDHAPIWKRERTADGRHRWVGMMEQPTDP